MTSSWGGKPLSLSGEGIGLVCAKLPASDDEVESSANAVMENKSYALVPGGGSEVNSNSAPAAVYEDASGMPAPFFCGAIGQGQSEEVDFDKDEDGQADEDRSEDIPKKADFSKPLFGGRT
jgi:hypothetical protein